MPLICQPPRITLAAPLVAHFLPAPNGEFVHIGKLEHVGNVVSPPGHGCD